MLKKNCEGLLFFSGMVFLAGIVLLPGCALLRPAQDPVVHRDSLATEFFRRGGGWEAGDGAFTVPLSDGRVLWTFGDSYTNQLDPVTGTVPCLFNARNAAMLQPSAGNWDPAETRTLLDSTRRFFRNPNPDNWVWPASGIQLGDTVFVFCFNLRHTAAGGPFGFEKAGPDLWNKVTFPEMEVAGSTPIQDFDGISFGQGFVADTASGFVYAYGSRGAVPCSVYVARFPFSDPYDWKFWDGKDWDSDVKAAFPVAEGQGFSISVCRISGKYLLTGAEFSLGCDMGKNIYVAVSDHPTGPFTERKVIYTIPDQLEGHSPFFYGAVLHPHTVNAHGEVLMTYSINGYGDCVETCVDGKYNPDHYRPKGVRIPLSLVDQKFR